MCLLRYLKVEILNNYLEYRKNKPKYSEWQNKREENLAKKEQYLKENPLTQKEKDLLLQKANVVLNAVDTMDEFSQTKAENTEVATTAITELAMTAAMGIGIGAGALFAKSKGGQVKIENLIKKHPKLANFLPMMPSVAGTVISLPFVAPLIIWATKNQVFASKIGRHDAVKTQLNSENQFAILNNKQIEELNKIAETIEIDKKEEKNNTPKGIKGAKATIDDITHENTEVQEYLKAQNEQFEKEKENFDKPLSEAETIKAKEEQQLITQVVEAADKASQDYAEDVEFGTNALITSGALIGAAAGFVAKGIVKLVSKIKHKNIGEKAAKIASKAMKKTGSAGNKLPWIAAFAGMMTAGIIATKLQKQASRVARFKVIQDFKNNPEKLAYVDEEKLKDIETTENKKEEKKENLFQFYARLFKENREYNKYLKANGDKDKQLKLARNKIELSDKQRTDAKQLQQNVIKTFNKIDDKSQTYSESTEALGEIIQNYGSSFFAIGGSLLSMALMIKNANKKSLTGSTMFKSFIPMIISIIPTIALDAYVTKEQKNSSRIAHMMAIDELQDYRHFANYDATSVENDKAKKTVKSAEENLKSSKNPEQENKKEPEINTETKAQKKTAEESLKETSKNSEKQPAEGKEGEQTKEASKESVKETSKAEPTEPKVFTAPFQKIRLDGVFKQFS